MFSQWKPVQIITHCTLRLQMLDCTTNPDGTITLDTMPDMICWEGDHFVFAALGAARSNLKALCTPSRLPFVCSVFYRVGQVQSLGAPRLSPATPHSHRSTDTVHHPEYSDLGDGA